VATIKDLKVKIERRLRDTEHTVGALATNLNSSVQHLQSQIEEMREPLKVELGKLRSENTRLYTAFESQKEDYRELTGGFLKVVADGQPVTLTKDPFL